MGGNDSPLTAGLAIRELRRGTDVCGPRWNAGGTVSRDRPERRSLEQVV